MGKREEDMSKRKITKLPDPKIEIFGEDYDKLPYDKKCDFDDGFVEKDPIRPCLHILGLVYVRREGEEFARVIYVDDDDDKAIMKKEDKFCFCPLCGEQFEEEV